MSLLAVDWFGTAVDVHPALRALYERSPELFEAPDRLVKELVTEEHLAFIVAHCTPLERPPTKLLCCYYTDHPDVDLKLIQKWCSEHRYPKAPVFRVFRGDPNTYEQLLRQTGAKILVDDNPPIALKYRHHISVLVPRRDWNRWFVMGPSWQMAPSIEAYLKENGIL